MFGPRDEIKMEIILLIVISLCELKVIYIYLDAQSFKASWLIQFLATLPDLKSLGFTGLLTIARSY